MRRKSPWLSGIVVLLITAGCSGNRWRSAEGATWGTAYHITYLADRDLHDSIVAVMRGVELSLSPFNDSSTVSRINRGESDMTDPLFDFVFGEAMNVWKLSGGAFDPTVAPAVNLWGFGYREGGECSEEEVDSVRSLVGMSRSTLSGGRLSRPQGMEFDFSAITKGYGCDAVGEMLRRNGCEDYMVEIGGEIALSGRNSRGGEWRIMVDKPVENDTAVVHERLTVIEVTDCGIATSGNYRNYKRQGVRKVWHTIDPRTCRPAEQRLLSATVIAPQTITADALATACMVMAPDSAIEMIMGLEGVEAILVLPDGSVTATDSRIQLP